MSCWLLVPACMRTVSPLKLERLACALRGPKPGFSDCLTALETQSCTIICSVISYKSQPWGAGGCWFEQFCAKTETRSCGQSLCLRTVSDTGWPELSWQERKVVKAEREKVGVRTGEKWWGKGRWVTWEGRSIPFRAATSEDTIICFQSSYHLNIRTVGKKRRPLFSQLELFRRPIRFIWSQVLLVCCCSLHKEVTVFWSKPEGTTIHCLASAFLQKSSPGVHLQYVCTFVH